jgi:probable rRNA maturation factor
LRRNRIRKRVKKLLSALECDRAEVSLVFVDDDEMQTLNRTWRAKDRPTDVLAFSQREGRSPPVSEDLLGDVVISVETAERQARERGENLEDELDLLIIHGILHLLGYEHEGGGKRAQEMRKKEKEMLKMLWTRDRP